VFNAHDLIRKQLGGKLSDSEVLKLANKHKVTACYETDRYILFQMSEMSTFSNRGMDEPPRYPYIIYYDKGTGKTTRVEGRGFEDDLLGFDYFYPELGVFDEKMITFIWPYELFDYIKECQGKGREVNPKLLVLSKRVKVEDNPILILVHLKK
jgi:hypothetical protein